jgi:hypothetical protein
MSTTCAELTNNKYLNRIVVSKQNHMFDHHQTWTFEVLVMMFEVFSEGT